jgi:DNA helicase HerA-like ATPase
VLSKEDYVLAELLGKDSPEVKALVAAAANADMQPAVHEMLRSLARQKGFNPDDLPRLALPQEISESNYVIGTAMSGDVVGEEVGISEVDLHSHIGVFGMTATGKSTLVKLLLMAFLKKEEI